MEENSLNANNIHASDNITDDLVVLSTSARTIENETGIKGPICLQLPNKYMEIIYTTKVKTNPSNWAPLSPYEQMFLDPDCTIEIVHANEEVYNKLKNFRKNKSTNKFRSRNAIAKNHKIEVKEILDKIKKKCRDRIADSESSNGRENQNCRLRGAES